MSTQKTTARGFGLVPEETRTRSHKYLANSIYLLENCKKSTPYLNSDVSKKKLVHFYLKFYEVLNRFADVYLDYKYPGKINLFNRNIDQEVKTASLYIQELCRVIKIRLAVSLQTNGKAHDIIRRIFVKANTKMQHFLIQVDYWNKVMLERCTVD